MVEPIKSIADINKIKEQILEDYSYKHYFYFILGINTGLMCLQALSLKWTDIKEKNSSKYILLKTPAGKSRKVYLNSTCVRGLRKLKRLYPHDIWLFQSKRGKLKAWNTNRPYMFLTEIAKKLGLKVKIGTHSLRKTFGYHALKSGNWSVGELSVYLSHYNPTRTKKYICWDEPQKDTQSFKPKIS